MLAASVCAAAGGFVPPFRPANAAAPRLRTQAPGWYRLKVGSFEVTLVTDGARVAPFPDDFVRNKTKEERGAGLDALFLPRDQMMLQYNDVVVNTGSKLIAIDAGNGPGLLATSNGRVGRGQANLAAAGIDINAIDAVVISHFHGDHINGLVSNGKPSYPNAEVMVPAPEWAFWMDDGNVSRAAGMQVGQFETVRRVFGALGSKPTMYEPDKEVLPGIKAVPAYGHTPGHMMHLLQSDESQLMLSADLVIGPLFLRNPDWHVMFDLDPIKAAETRHRVCDQLAADKVLVHGSHFPFPAVFNIEKNGSRYRETPMPWNPAV